MKPVRDLVWNRIRDLPRGRVTDRVCERLRLPKTTVARHLNDLMEIGIVRNAKVSNMRGTGRDSLAWKPTEEFKTLWTVADLFPRKRMTVV